MVGLAVALRLALLRGALRGGAGSAARQVAFVLGLVFGAGLGLCGSVVLAVTSGRTQADVATVLFTLVLGGWLVLPILTASSDELLDPSRLAMLPLTRRQLATVLAVASLVGVPAAATTVFATGLVVGAARSPGTALAAVLAALLFVALCVSASRLLGVLLSGLLRSRRGRDLGVAVTALAALSPQLVNLAFQRELASGDGLQTLRTVASPLRALPTGWLASAPELVAAGHGGVASARLLLLAGVVTGLVFAWQAAVGRALTSVDRTTGGRGRERPVRTLPGGRLAAVAGKDLRYLRRDPKRLVGVFTLLPLAAIVVLGPALRGGGIGPGSIFLVTGLGVFMSQFSGNRFGADGTASWLLVAALGDRRDARRDLLGGDVAAALVMAPLLLVVTLVMAPLVDAGRYAPDALGAGLALLGVGIGLSGLVSVLAPLAVPDKPSSSFAGANGAGGLAVGLAFGQLLGVPLLCLPLLPLLLAGLHSTGAAVALLVLGPLYGVALGAVLRELAARRWAATAPEVLQKLLAGRA